MNNHVHSLNNSPAKQKYSFGKEGRFRYGKPQYHNHHSGPMPTIFPPLTATGVVHLSATENDHWEYSTPRKATRTSRIPTTYPPLSKSNAATPSRAADTYPPDHPGRH